MKGKKQKILKGIPASNGIAIGKVFLLERADDLYIPIKKISKEEVKEEINKYKSALEKTKKELLAAKERILKSLGKQHAAFVEVYVSIVDDPLLTRDVVRMIEEEMVVSEYATNTVLNRIIATFEKIEDEYFRGRASDIRDVVRKILRNILGKKRKELTNITSEHIVVAHTLSPHDTALLKEKKCIGFAIDVGTKTSHISLIAQGLELPAVVGLKNITTEIEDGGDIILDGYEGIVIVNPDKETLEEYRLKLQKIAQEKEYLAKLKNLPAETVDGHKVKIMVNLDNHTELEKIDLSGTDGVGLFRTEYLYLGRDELPSEKELTEVYTYVAEKLYPLCVVIRTMDLGGDKLSRFNLEGFRPEPSPALGLRGIRVSLKYKDIFKTQLTAILRASVKGNIKIMFPMISAVQEFKEAKKIVEEVKIELENKNVKFDKNIPLGAMIETPSAALTCDIISKEADFISIGTNDLIQYTLVVDRMNENVAEMYEPLHLSILRLVKYIIESSHKNGKQVDMCGDMAADTAFTKILLGMGLDVFSVPIGKVLEIKKLIRSFSFSEAKELVEDIFSKDNREDVITILKNKKIIL